MFLMQWQDLRMMPYLIKFFLALIAGVLVVTYVPQLSLLFVHLFGQ